MPLFFWKKSPPGEAKCFQCQDHLASSPKQAKTEQDNLLSRIPQLLNDLQATLPAEYNVLAGLVSLPPVFTFCHNNFDNFSDRTISVSAESRHSLNLKKKQKKGFFSHALSSWLLLCSWVSPVPLPAVAYLSPCPVTTQDYFLKPVRFKSPTFKGAAWCPAPWRR